MRKWLALYFMSVLLSVQMLACTPATVPATSPSASPAAKPEAKAAPIASLSPEETAWQQVVEAAKKEGRVVIYTTPANPPFRRAMADAFDNKYGIKTEWMVLRGAESKERLLTEQRAGRLVGDIYHGGPSPMIDMIEKGLLAESQPPIVGREPSIWAVDPYYYDKDGRLVVVAMSDASTMLLNTQMVKPDAYPKSWLDLVEPMWKGKMILDDPTIGGSGSTAFSSLLELFGEDYWRRMAKQDIKIMRSRAEEARAIATGERALSIQITAYAALPYLEAGAPVALHTPKEGNIKTPYPMSIVKNAPHINAAKVLVDFLLSKEGQNAQQLFGHAPIRKDVRLEVHPQIEAAVKAPELVRQDLAFTQKRVEHMRLRLAADILGLGK